MTTDGVYRTRSLGVPTEGIPDQYSDGKAAKVWEFYIGQKEQRTDKYKHFLVNLLKSHLCRTVLDVACGTGVDSIMLLEEGFQVYSVDASDKMLKYALKERWERRKEPAFDGWMIEEANWLTLPEDITSPEDTGYDAVICLGNSFAHLPDFEGTQEKIRLAIRNFERMVRPGGILLIDHRNYDVILDTGVAPKKNIYYDSSYISDIKTSVLMVNGRHTMVTLDYIMDMSSFVDQQVRREEAQGVQRKGMLRRKVYDGPALSNFRLSYYPHRLKDFSATLESIFPEGSTHTIFGDFQPLEETTEPPSFFIHAIRKPGGPSIQCGGPTLCSIIP